MSSRFTPKALRAINWLAQRDELVVALSAPPNVRFKKRSSGDHIEYPLVSIIDWYDADRKAKLRDPIDTRVRRPRSRPKRDR